MGLSSRLAGIASSRVHVLTVEVPGWWSTRVAADQAIARRGWVQAAGAADADALLVCGAPGEGLAAAVNAVWEQLPGPRARASLLAPADAGTELDRLAVLLEDTAAQVADARGRTGWSPPPGEQDHMAPVGIPLADGGPDRDGLEMDLLRVPLGPVLAHWPAGLRLTVSMQGDVVVDAAADLLVADSDATRPPTEPSPATRAAVRVDAARDVLALAGWDAAADDAARTRDLLLAGEDAGWPRLDRLARRVTRSRVLSWSLRGLGPPGRDVRDRLSDLLRDAATARTDGLRPIHEVDPERLPDLVRGLDLAAVRLVVAAARHLDPAGQAVPRG